MPDQRRKENGNGKEMDRGIPQPDAYLEMVGIGRRGLRRTVAKLGKHLRSEAPTQQAAPLMARPAATGRHSRARTRAAPPARTAPAPRTATAAAAAARPAGHRRIFLDGPVALLFAERGDRCCPLGRGEAQ